VLLPIGGNNLILISFEPFGFFQIPADLADPLTGVEPDLCETSDVFQLSPIGLFVTAQDPRFHGYYLWVCPGAANENGILARSTDSLLAVLDGKLEGHDRSGYIALRIHYFDCGIAIHPITSLWPALIVCLDVIEHEAFINPSVVKIINFLRIEGGLDRPVIGIAGG